MKKVKFLCLSLSLLCGVLILAWCEKANNNENLSCENDDTCPIQNTNNENQNIEIEESPSVIINDTDEEWTIFWNIESTENLKWNQENPEIIEAEPMMRKMVVDENATPEEIENDMIETCGNLGWNRTDWMCTLEDGSQIAF